MGRRKNNPELVDYLKQNGGSMDSDEFAEKYWSLSSNDRDRLDREIREEFWSYGNDDDESEEGYSVYDAALAWLSSGKDEDYTFGYSEEELEDALR